jgi:hypothetical protein
MVKEILLFSFVLMAATNEACAANGTAWSLGSKKSKIAPQPTAAEGIRSGNAVAPEPLKKTPSLDSTDSETSSESEAEKRIRINENWRFFEGLTQEIVDSHYVPMVAKSKSLPWIAPQERIRANEQYNQCSRDSITNRLINCTSECITNAFELFSGLGKERELQNLCVMRCVNSGKQFLIEKAEQIERYNDKQQRR